VKLKARLYAVETRRTAAFDAGQRVEIKLELEPGQRYEGEIYLRIPAAEATEHHAGKTYSLAITEVD
jgi:hypothetical protein